MSIVGKFLESKAEELSRLGAKPLTRKVTDFVRTLGSFPLVGVEIIHFIIVSVERGRLPADETRRIATDLCVRLIARDTRAETELEIRVHTFLEVNQALTRR